MNTKIGLAFCALAVAAPAWISLRAEEPARPLNTGRVLVLDTERTIEGDIERQGEHYKIRRSVGELWVKAQNVLRLCDSREEAYAFLRTRANQRDPDERLRLAQWCQLQGLRKQALEEVAAAVELRPEHAPTRRLFANLQKAALVTPPAQTAKPAEEPEVNANLTAVSTESLSLFITRVQPTLMNACANCHASGRGGTFKLTRTYQGGSAGRKTTQQNLAATLAQVNKEQPKASALLIKAVSIHGEMAQPALKNRETPPYRALEEWIRVTLDNNPQLIANAAVTASPEVFPVKSETPTVNAAALKPADATKSPVNIPAESSVGGEPKEVGIPSSSTPAPPEPVDPFDPLIFNRQMHPQKSASGKK
jgi:hypothetical protein